MPGPTTPNRVFFACLGVAPCSGLPIGGIISAALSVSRDVTNIMSAGSKSPAITYPNSPSVELTVTRYYNGFLNFNTEPGILSPIGMDLMLGSDSAITNDLLFVKGNQAKTLRCKNMFLNDISYKFAVEGAFTTTLKYVGWMISSCTNSKDFSAPTTGSVPNRRIYSVANSNVAGFPSDVLTSVSIDQSITRQYIVEFASRANYAAYMTLPIKASVSLEGLASSSLTGYTLQDISSACKNFVDIKQNLKIATCGVGTQTSSLELSNTRLVSLGYSGGDASGSGNMTVSASFEAFVDATNITTTWISADADHIKEPCDC